MKLRQAIKIMRNVDDPIGRRGQRRWLWWKRRTIEEARRICSRKQMDERVPYIPDDRECSEGLGIMLSMFADVAITDHDAREGFKQDLWTALAEA